MSTDDRVDAFLWRRTAELLTSSRVDDAEPGSMTARRDVGWIEFAVRSRSRGRVAIGAVTDAELAAGVAAIGPAEQAAYLAHVRDAKADMFETVRAYAAELEERRLAPLAAKAARKARRRAEALRLRAAGRSVAYIARELHVDVRTVERYLAAADSATGRETPG